MPQAKKRSPIDEKLTLAQARARVSEVQPMEKVEGNGAGAAVRSGQSGKRGSKKS